MIRICLLVMLSIFSTCAIGQRVFDVKAYGALGDGKANDAAAIQKAIDSCEQAGGGQVLFPSGKPVYFKHVLESHSVTGMQLFNLTGKPAQIGLKANKIIP